MAVHTMEDLQQMQALPLNLKVRLTQSRIRAWVNEFGEDGVYVSFSGGKDSTVLLHIVRELYPNVEAVFCDTGLEYPEIREFVKTFDNVTWLKPKMNFRKVVETYGYPFISKEVSECVYGARKYLTRITASESLDRQTDRQTVGCYRYIGDLLGLERRAKRESPLYAELKKGNIPKEELLFLAHMNDAEQHEYSYETTRMLGLVDYYRAKRENDPEATRFLPARFKILLGIYEHRSKGVENGESSNMWDRSRYAFFLDAPFEISHMCCGVMKKNPMNKFHKETGKVSITAQMASESRLRTLIWLKNGCNAFHSKKQVSNPMSFWTEQDVLQYIVEHDIPICSVYGDIVKVNEVQGQLDLQDLGLIDLGHPRLKTTGCSRTGCMFCGFGCHLEKEGEGRFERMKVTHPKQYQYIMKPWGEGGLGYKEVIDWINEHGNLHIRY